MLREIFRKRDIIILSSMIFLAIGFFIFSLLAPHQQKHPGGEEMTIEPEAVQRSTTFMPSRKVKQGTSLSASQAEERESNDAILDSKQEITGNQTENTPPYSEKDVSGIVPADLSNHDEEQKDKEESYPVGDMRRLTPQEQIHYQQLIERMQALDREQRAWVDLPLPLEERIAREEAHYKRLRPVAGQINYYDIKLGYPSVPGGIVVDPYVDGDLAKK